MVTVADMPWWLVMMIFFGFAGPFMRMQHRRWDRHGSKALRDPEVQRLDQALAERDQVIEDLQRRLGEVEERQDFTERLLAERNQVPLS